MLDSGACAFWSNWGSGDAVLHWDMTPGCLSTFPMAGKRRGADSHWGQLLSVLFQGCLGGWGAAHPGAQCIALRAAPQKTAIQWQSYSWALYFSPGSWGNLKQGKGRAEGCGSLILGRCFFQTFFLAGCLLYVNVWVFIGVGIHVLLWAGSTLYNSYSNR